MMTHMGSYLWSFTSMMTHVVLVLLSLWTTLVGVAQCLISCDFEDGLCGWSDLSNSSYDWTRLSGPTADFTSGPDNDHTFKDVTGHYVYTNGDRAARCSVAQLRSNTVTLTSSVNLTFWYHMNGNGIGNVSLIRGDSDTDDGIVLWSRHGRQGFNWLESHVTLDPGTFQLQFESTVSHPYGSDIALDDIRLWSEPHVARTRPPSTSTIETTQTSTQGTSTTTAWHCNVQSPVGVLMSGSCDFETNGTCGYTSSGGALQWGLTQGKKGYLYVIPGDHGTGTGQYMYLATDTVSSRSGDMARLTSPALELDTSACLHFAYIITSGDPITLTVYAETSGQRRLIASITTHGMTSWRVRENVTLCADTSTKIVFEGTKKSHASFIGLDDITVTSGDCNGSYSHTTSHQSTLVTSTPSSASTSSSPTSTARTTFTPTEGAQTVVPPSSSVSSSTASTKGQTGVSPTTPSASPSRQASSTKPTGHSFAYTEETSPETTHASTQQSGKSSSPAGYSVSVEVTGSVSDSSSPANPSTERNSAATTEETVIADTHTTSSQDNITAIPEATSTITVLSTASETSNNNKSSSSQTSPSVTSRTRLPRTTTHFSKKHGQSSHGGLSYDNTIVVIVVACGALLIVAVGITVWRLRARRKLHLSNIPSTLDSNIELQAKVAAAAASMKAFDTFQLGGISPFKRRMESETTSTSKVQDCSEKKQEKTSPERSWRVISPLKRLPSQPGNMRLFSPVDSDQELNDLEVENAFGDGAEPDSSQSLLSPSKARRYETPGKLNLSPFRPSTVMTNLHRGNVQTMTPSIVEHMSIHQMSAQGELVMLQQEIQEGSDINKLDEQGLTALHWACANGQMPTMEFLVQSGADINLSGNHGENALLLSSCYGYKEIVKYLLQLGMDVNCTDESGSTALMYAAYNNHPACITALLEYGADITATNEDMLTAFDLTIGQDHKLAQHAIEKHMLSMFEGLT